LIAVEGIEDRDAARRLAGTEITVARTEIGLLEPDEYLVDDLVGLAVVDGADTVGKVKNVLLLPSADVLDVERADGSQLLVPLISDAIRSIAAGRIDVRLDFLGEG
jgi:16S rRNA processing protein RimM